MLISGPQKQNATFGLRVAGFVTPSDGLVVRQQSCAPGILCSVWSYHLSPGWGAQRHGYAYFFEKEPGLCQEAVPTFDCFSCFCIPSLPWLAIVWIHPLELREGQGGWMKPISYRQEMENTEQISTPEPHRVLLSFNLGNRATMTVITSCQNGA